MWNRVYIEEIWASYTRWQVVTEAFCEIIAHIRKHTQIGS